jgi:hypothetical protein
MSSNPTPTSPVACVALRDLILNLLFDHPQADLDNRDANTTLMTFILCQVGEIPSEEQPCVHVTARALQSIIDNLLQNHPQAGVDNYDRLGALTAYINGQMDRGSL